jgi:hypothetical protein
MAQWVTRQRADRAVSVQIKWRMDGRWQSETFTDLRLAAEFRTARATFGRPGRRRPGAGVARRSRTIGRDPGHSRAVFSPPPPTFKAIVDMFAAKNFRLGIGAAQTIRRRRPNLLGRRRHKRTDAAAMRLPSGWATAWSGRSRGQSFQRWVDEVEVAHRF